jgi:hypothetical protein
MPRWLLPLEKRNNHLRVGNPICCPTNMIAKWKCSVVKGAADIFDKGPKSRKQTEKRIDEP